jgi:tryptophan-rich sensory protein
MVVSLLSTPIFVSSREKKMGYVNKLVAIALFVATIIYGKINGMATSLLLLPIFSSSKNKEKMGDASKLIIVALFM